ncbi:VWA domain-containing protein [Candidatus Poribacteria bacterium]|nr:VWA domain-containing protein [Candidatus Poribacteria bacterium]
MCFGLARPQWGAKPESVSERLDVYLALDISTSMLAKDTNSDRRLTQAKHLMSDLLTQLGGNRVGILYFAEESFVVCPLTYDFHTLSEFLDAVTPETIVHRGTNIGNAMNVVSSRLTTEQDRFNTELPNSRAHKIVILFTDGEDHSVGTLTEVESALQNGIYTFCIGVGSANKPTPILLPEKSKGYKRDMNGQLVLTKLDEQHLMDIASSGNGQYYHVNEGISKLVSDLSKLEKQKYRIRSDGEYQDRYQWFVGFALLLLIMELLMPRIWKT